MGSVGASTKHTYTLYHGSPNANLTNLVANPNTHTYTGENFIFFTDSEEMADQFSYEFLPSDTGSQFLTKKGNKGKVYIADVTMKKPLNLTNLSKSDIKNVLAMSDGELDTNMIKKFSSGNNQLLKSYIDLTQIEKYGYDGFIAKMNKKGDLEYAVLDSSQVKLKEKK